MGSAASTTTKMEAPDTETSRSILLSILDKLTNALPCRGIVESNRASNLVAYEHLCHLNMPSKLVNTLRREFRERLAHSRDVPRPAIDREYERRAVHRQRQADISREARGPLIEGIRHA